MEHSELRFSSDKSELDIDLIHTFLRDETAWAKGIAKATVERSIEGSLCFGVYLGSRQIGFARVVTDMATFGYLCDVFVLRQFRSRGYAKALMQHIFESDVMQGLRRIVLVTTEAHEVYRPFGFSALAHPERYMELHRPQAYSRS